MLRFFSNDNKNNAQLVSDDDHEEKSIAVKGQKKKEKNKKVKGFSHDKHTRLIDDEDDELPTELVVNVKGKKAGSKKSSGFPIIEEIDSENGALVTTAAAIAGNAMIAKLDEEEQVVNADSDNEEEENKNEEDCSECRLSLEREKARRALLCFQDNVVIAATLGGAGGTALGAATAYLACCPSMFCAPQNDKTKFMRKARNVGGALGLYAGGGFGAGMGVFASLFQIPCAYQWGRPAACATITEKITNKSLNLLVEDHKPQSQRMG